MTALLKPDYRRARVEAGVKARDGPRMLSYGAVGAAGTTELHGDAPGMQHHGVGMAAQSPNSSSR